MALGELHEVGVEVAAGWVHVREALAAGGLEGELVGEVVHHALGFFRVVDAHLVGRLRHAGAARLAQRAVFHQQAPQPALLAARGQHGGQECFLVGGRVGVVPRRERGERAVRVYGGDGVELVDGEALEARALDLELLVIVDGAVACDELRVHRAAPCVVVAEKLAGEVLHPGAGLEVVCEQEVVELRPAGEAVEEAVGVDAVLVALEA